MFKTIKEIQDHKDRITSKGLQTAIIYFKSPILNAIEERHIYADDVTELNVWLRETCDFYKEKNICFISYINDSIQAVNGDIITNFLGLED